MGATPLGYEIAKKFGHSISPVSPSSRPLEILRRRKREPSRSRRRIGDGHRAVRRRNVPRKTSLHALGPERPRNLASLIVLELAKCRLRDDRSRAGAGMDSRNSKWRERRDPDGLRSALRIAVPKRLADLWIEKHPPKDWTNQSLELMEEGIHQWEVSPAGTEGYEKAEVTAGGVNTKELSSKTMESQKSPGLYFIGEVVDVTGWLGGFNFQWAWASAVAAGKDIASRTAR